MWQGSRLRSHSSPYVQSHSNCYHSARRATADGPGNRWEHRQQVDDPQCDCGGSSRSRSGPGPSTSRTPPMPCSRAMRLAVLLLAACCHPVASSSAAAQARAAIDRVHRRLSALGSATVEPQWANFVQGVLDQGSKRVRVHLVGPCMCCTSITPSTPHLSPTTSRPNCTCCACALPPAPPAQAHRIPSMCAQPLSRLMTHAVVRAMPSVGIRVHHSCPRLEGQEVRVLVRHHQWAEL